MMQSLRHSSREHKGVQGQTSATDKQHIQLVKDHAIACIGPVQWPCAMALCIGPVQWPCAMASKAARVVCPSLSARLWPAFLSKGISC